MMTSLDIFLFMQVYWTSAGEKGNVPYTNNQKKLYHLLFYLLFVSHNSNTSLLWQEIFSEMNLVFVSVTLREEIQGVTYFLYKHCKIQNRKVTGIRWKTLTTRNEIEERLGIIVTDCIVLFVSNCQVPSFMLLRDTRSWFVNFGFNPSGSK